jgi:hypothetical protein
MLATLRSVARRQPQPKAPTATDFVSSIQRGKTVATPSCGRPRLAPRHLRCRQRQMALTRPASPREFCSAKSDRPRKWQRHAPSPSRRYDVRAQDAETGLSVLVRHSLDEACRHFSRVWLRSHADHRIFAFALALLIIGLAQRLSSLWPTRLT